MAVSIFKTGQEILITKIEHLGMENNLVCINEKIESKLCLICSSFSFRTHGIIFMSYMLSSNFMMLTTK